jgi:AmmeMemoRadiSam system protein A
MGCLTPHPPIIIPWIGQDALMQVNETVKAMERVSEGVASHKPETIVFISPHSAGFADGFAIKTSPVLTYDFSDFGKPEPAFSVRNDVEFADKLIEIGKDFDCRIVGVNRDNTRMPAISKLDHGVSVPLYYLSRSILIDASSDSKTSIVSLTIDIGSYDIHFVLGKAIAKTAEITGRRTVFVASGDLSHRLTRNAPNGYSPRGMEFDARIESIFKSGHLNDVKLLETDLINAAGECGLRSIYALAGVFDGMQVNTEVLSHEGPFGVGYMVATVDPVVDSAGTAGSAVSAGIGGAGTESVMGTVDYADSANVSSIGPAYNTDSTSTSSMRTEGAANYQAAGRANEASRAETATEAKTVNFINETNSGSEDRVNENIETPQNDDAPENIWQMEPQEETSGETEAALRTSIPVELAKLSLSSFFKLGCAIDPPENIPAEFLNKRAGAFVCLKKGGNLRGCIGTIQPTYANLAEEIMANAIQAAVADPRFDPVNAAELPHLTYSVDVLGEPEPIDTKELLDPKVYGVIVRSGFKTGLLLPNLDGVDTIDDQIEIAKRKAGIGRFEDVELYRFKVIRYE